MQHLARFKEPYDSHVTRLKGSPPPHLTRFEEVPMSVRMVGKWF